MLTKLYGRAAIGEKVLGKISGRKETRESIVAGLKGKQLIAPLCYQGTCNQHLFYGWCEQLLIPELDKGDTVILDNASPHKDLELLDLFAEHDINVIFLPPYSPDLNPIEKIWAVLKRYVRKVQKNFDTIFDALSAAVKNYCDKNYVV